MTLDYKERDAAIRKDIQYMPITAVAKKWNTTRQNVSRIVGSVRLYRNRFTSKGVISGHPLARIVERCPTCLMDVWTIPSRPKMFCNRECASLFYQKEKYIKEEVIYVTNTYSQQPVEEDSVRDEGDRDRSEDGL